MKDKITQQSLKILILSFLLLFMSSFNQVFSQVSPVIDSPEVLDCGKVIINITRRDGEQSPDYWINYGDGSSNVSFSTPATGTSTLDDHQYLRGEYIITIYAADGSTNIATYAAIFTTDIIANSAAYSLQCNTTGISGTISCPGTYYIDYGDNSPIKTLTAPYSGYYFAATNSSSNNIKHYYSAAGDYEIKISDRSDFNNPYTMPIGQPVVIDGFDLDFDLEATVNGCGEVSFVLTEGCSFGGDFCIDYGDGVYQPLEIANNTDWAPYNVSCAWTHQYLSTGNKTVTIKPCGGDGTVHIADVSFDVFNIMTASFMNTTACVGDDTEFTNTTQGADSYIWNFGDGGTSTDASPTHPYSSSDTYNVVLTAIDASGTCQAAVSHQVDVLEPPNADFAFVNNVCSGVPVEFVINSEQIGSTFEWNFGDGTSNTSISNPIHPFQSAGTYTVDLVVQNACGGSEISKDITILGEGNAVIDAVGVACPDEQISFDNIGQSGATTLCTWDFGDGNTATGCTDITHQYSSEGNYNVTLSVSSGTESNCNSVDLHSIVIGQLPNAEITLKTEPYICDGGSIELDSYISNYINGENYSYQWLLGGVPIAGATASIYNATLAGDYSLVVTGTCGSFTTDEVAITIIPDPSVAVQLTDASCSSVANGTAVLSSSTSNLSDFEILWPAYTNLAVDVTTANVLRAGALHITLIEVESGCRFNINETIESHDIQIDVSSSSPSCTDGINDGAIDITVSGGVVPSSSPDYYYDWDNDGVGDQASDPEDIDLLQVGIYQVTVTENVTGCQGTAYVNLTMQSISLLVENDDVSDCGGTGVPISVVGTDSHNPTDDLNYLFTKSDDTEVSPAPHQSGVTVSQILLPGEYIVKVENLNTGCSKELDNIIIESGQAISATVESDLTTSCNAEANASLTVTPANGIGGYSYEWMEDAGTDILSVTNELNNVSAGTYDVTVTDSRGCQAVSSTDIPEPALLEVTIEDVTACSVIISVQGGEANYTVEYILVVTEVSSTTGLTSTYELVKKVENNVLPGDLTVNDLDEGDGYIVRVTDANGCVVESSSFSINLDEDSRTFIVYIHWNEPEITEGEPDDSNPEVIDVITDAETQMYDDLQKCKSALRADYESQLEDFLSKDVNERLPQITAQYNSNHYHYTLYYYDRAGNLVKTVPPKGVDKTFFPEKTAALSSDIMVNHSLETEYKYNSFNQLIWQSTPDGGETSFYYDAKGRLRFSQNAKQDAEATYSYTKYDNLGRIIESGESNQDESNFDTYVDNLDFPADYDTKTVTVYDDNSGEYYFGKSQRFTHNKVSYSYSVRNANPGTIPATEIDKVTSYYSYDPHGNVEWLIQDIPGFTKNYIAYEYDLVSGNVKKVKYNEKRPDRLFHKYDYDADNRIEAVYTSRDDEIWEKDANYKYYDHGPLQRVEIGEDKIQGLDYVYTVNGWLKAINNPMPGGDPNQDINNVDGLILGDAFSMSLGYYNGDYKGADKFLTDNVEDVVNRTNLYNGNIGIWTSKVGVPEPTSFDFMRDIRSRSFKYDELNRLLSSHNFLSDYSEHPDFQPDFQPKLSYNTSYEYDPNGNLEILKRQGTPSLPINEGIDHLEYTYEAGTNQLTEVRDAISTTSGFNSDFVEGATYLYDEIGNLVKTIYYETEDGVTIPKQMTNYIDWNVSGKINTITISEGTNSETHPARKLLFTYDAMGNRISKEVKRFNSSFMEIFAENKQEYYVRDASGNTMAIYSRTIENVDLSHVGKPLADINYYLKEMPIYGSDRLGLIDLKENSLIYSLTGVALADICGNSNFSIDINTVSINKGLYHWVTPHHAGVQTNANTAASTCNCKIEELITAPDAVLASQAELTEFFGKVDNNVGVSEDQDGNLNFYSISAENYLGNDNIMLVLDKDGNLMKGSSGILSSPESKAISFKIPGNNSKYLLITLDEDRNVYSHTIDMGLDGFGPVGSALGEVVSINQPLNVLDGVMNRYFNAIEDEPNNRVILFASEYTEPASQGERGTVNILAYEIKASQLNPVPEIIASIESFDKLGQGELQLSEDAKRLLYYNRTEKIAGFNYWDVDVVSLGLNEDYLTVDPTQISHVSTIGGAYGNTTADFNGVDGHGNHDILFGQQSTIAYDNIFDKQVWYYNRILTGPPTYFEYFNERGDIRKALDTYIYLPGEGNSSHTINQLTLNPTNWNELDIANLTGYIQKGTLPGQILKIRDLETESVFYREVGSKKYELKDHLGNVRVVVGDVRIGVEKSLGGLNSGVVDNFTADIKSINDYYPFGMIMPGRSYNNTDYRFGFNGMEKDDEIHGVTGSSYTTEFRQYDTRIARWLSIDPLVANFPWQSPYVAFDNNPIYYKDPKGAASEGGDGDDRVKESKSREKKQTYKQVRPLNLEDSKTDCSEHVYSVMKKTNPEIAKGFVKDGGVNTRTIKSYINKNGGFRKTKPKNGDLIMWEGHVEYVTDVDGEKFLTHGAGGGSGAKVPRPMGKSKNGYVWLNTSYNKIGDLGSGKYLGIWTPTSKTKPLLAKTNNIAVQEKIIPPIMLPTVTISGKRSANSYMTPRTIKALPINL